MNLIIDIGNSRVKMAIVEENIIIKKITCKSNGITLNIKKLRKEYAIDNCIISSVSKHDFSVQKSLDGLKKIIYLDHQTKIPLINDYHSPTTLGVDRIALASAAIKNYPNKNVLVIDAGTCITYDFISSDKNYLGGAISPGIVMRYRSLHEFTANLPLLNQNEFNLIGKDTNSSIHSGVLNGSINEIDGVIDQYKTKYLNLTVVLTGGDTIFLAKKLKSTIFANPNFLLEGLNSILIHNLDE